MPRRRVRIFRRDTRVPPYRVQRFYEAGRVVRPYGRDAAAVRRDTKKSCPKAALFDLVISGVRLRSSPAPS